MSQRLGIATLLVLFVWLCVSPSNRSVRMLYKGDSNFLDGHDSPALQNYRQAASLQPDWWRPYLRQGMVLQRMGQLEEAIAAYEKGLALNPWDPETLTRGADCMIKAGQYDKARVLIRRRMSIEPNCFDCLLLLSNASAGEGDYRQADRFLARAEEVNPYNPGIHLERAKLRQHFDLSLAIESCQATLGLGAIPHERRLAFLLLSDLYRQQGKKKEARESLQTLITAYPESPEAQSAQTLLSALE